MAEHLENQSYKSDEGDASGLEDILISNWFIVISLQIYRVRMKIHNDSPSIFRGLGPWFDLAFY